MAASPAPPAVLVHCDRTTHGSRRLRPHSRAAPLRAQTRAPPLGAGTRGGLAEPGEPLLQQAEATAIDPVNAAAAKFLVVKQAGSLEHPKMPRGGRPCMSESPRNLARRHRAIPEMDRQKDLTSCRMCQGVEDGLERVEP